MHTPLRSGERPVREGAANHQCGTEAVGGCLYLTSERLLFEPHRGNLQQRQAMIELAAVQAVRPVWSKAFGWIPLFPNSIEVRTRDGRAYRFVVFGRVGWTALVQQAAAARQGVAAA